MKTLLAPILWGIAAVVAVGIAYRIWRGKPVVLKGTWSPQVVRLTAILLVAFGVAPKEPADRLFAEPIHQSKTDSTDTLPAAVTADQLTF